MYPNMNTAPLVKQITTIGNGTHTQFSVSHPSAPAVIYSVYNSATGEEARPDVTFMSGYVRFEFADIPSSGQYTVVMIG